MTVHDLLPNSSLLTCTRGATRRCSCRGARPSTTRYLIVDLLPRGHVCEQDIVPFTFPLTSAASAFEIEARRQVRGSLIPEMLMRANQ